MDLWFTPSHIGKRRTWATVGPEAAWEEEGHGVDDSSGWKMVCLISSVSSSLLPRPTLQNLCKMFIIPNLNSNTCTRNIGWCTAISLLRRHIPKKGCTVMKRNGIVFLCPSYLEDTRSWVRVLPVTSFANVHPYSTECFSTYRTL